MAAFKAYQEEIDDFDRRAAAEGLLKASGEPNRSEMIRLLVEYARRYMPAGWRPDATATPPTVERHE